MLLLTSICMGKPRVLDVKSTQRKGKERKENMSDSNKRARARKEFIEKRVRLYDRVGFA